MDWCDAYVISFDVETTGLNPWADRVIQFAASVWKGACNDVATALYEVDGGSLVLVCGTDGVPINPGAQRAHGISEADVAGQPSFDMQLGKLLSFLRPYTEQPHVWLAYNAPFDLSFLLTAFYRTKQVLPIEDTRAVLDPLTIARHFWRTNKLTELAARLGVPLTDAHNALHDCRAAALAMFALWGRHSAPLPDDLNELLEVQRRCIARWEATMGKSYWAQLNNVEALIKLEVKAYDAAVDVTDHDPVPVACTKGCPNVR